MLNDSWEQNVKRIFTFLKYLEEYKECLNVHIKPVCFDKLFILLRCLSVFLFVFASVRKFSFRKISNIELKHIAI